MTKEEKIELLVAARNRITMWSNSSLQYPVDSETVKRLAYCHGIRDACWAIDEMIEGLKNGDNERSCWFRAVTGALPDRRNCLGVCHGCEFFLKDPPKSDGDELPY